jgi:hypothetical protein
MTPEVIAAKTHLYQPNNVLRLRNEPSRQSAYGMGHRRFTGTNPTRGAQIYYSLKDKAEKASIKIIDYQGRTLRELPGKTEPGLHVVAWDLRAGGAGGGGQAGGPPGGGRGGGRRGGGGGQGGGESRSAATASSAQTTQPTEQASQTAGAPDANRAEGAAQSQPASNQPEAGQRRPGGAGTQQQQRTPNTIPAGMYRVVLAVDGQEFTQSIKIEGDVIVGAGAFGSEDEEQWEAEEEEEERPVIRQIIH